MIDLCDILLICVFFLNVLILLSSLFSFSSSNELEHSRFLLNKSFPVADLIFCLFVCWMNLFYVCVSSIYSLGFFFLNSLQLFISTQFFSLNLFCICVFTHFVVVVLNIYTLIFVCTIISSTGNINYFSFFNLNVHTKEKKRKTNTVSVIFKCYLHAKTFINIQSCDLIFVMFVRHYYYLHCSVLNLIMFLICFLSNVTFFRLFVLKFFLLQNILSLSAKLLLHSYQF